MREEVYIVDNRIIIYRRSKDRSNIIAQNNNTIGKFDKKSCSPKLKWQDIYSALFYKLI